VTYRELTRDELIRLGRELENYRRWEGVRDYVEALYAPGAHQVTISVLSEYNDNGYDPQVSVIVTDAAGDPLPYDAGRPWWARFAITPEQMAEVAQDRSGNLDAAYALGEEVLSALQTFCAEQLGIEFIEHWQPRDPVTYTFEVGTPPAVSHPKVFVVE
jgi:hypothetical protein